MKTYQIPHTDLVVSRIAYGCAMLGRWDTTPITGTDRARAAQAVHTAHENGITLFDHADLYGFGTSESIFGEVLKQSPGLRDKIVIQSKCGQVFSEGWRVNSGKPIRVDSRATHIIRSVEGSLRRLQTDHLDILLLHAPSALVNPQEVAQAFETLQRGGKTRYFGVSNHTGAQIELLRKAVRQPIVANQIQLGLGKSGAFTDGLEFTLELAQGTSSTRGYIGPSGVGTFDYCRLQDVQIQAWSPLPRELITPSDDHSPRVKDALRKLREIASAKATTPTAVALAWLLHHPAGIVPVIGARDPKHIAENCAADAVDLDDQEWYDLFAAWTDIKSRALPADTLGLQP